MREKFGGIPKDRLGPRINPDDVPEVLRPLIPMAEKWGVIEDGWRPYYFLREVPREEIEDLVATVAPYCTNDLNDPFDIWLGGSEAQEGEWTEAHSAFSELHIVFENAEWDLEHWDEIQHEGKG